MRGEKVRGERVGIVKWAIVVELIFIFGRKTPLATLTDIPTTPCQSMLVISLKAPPVGTSQHLAISLWSQR